MQGRRTFTATLFLGLVAAFSLLSQEVLNKASIGHFIPLPLTTQSTEYSCGAAAVQSICAYYGDKHIESELFKGLGTNPEYGTDHRQMLKFVQSKGFQAVAYEGMTIHQLRDFLSQGKPVICLIQAWEDNVTDYTDVWGDGHYAVAVGYDKERVYFLDPWMVGNYMYIPNQELIKRWHHLTYDKIRLVNWGMVVAKDSPVYVPDAVLYMP
jgi:predicted double-glycine peptidase